MNSKRATCLIFDKPRECACQRGKIESNKKTRMVASSCKGVEEIGMSDSAKTFLVARLIREPGLGMLNLFEMD